MEKIYQTLETVFEHIPNTLSSVFVHLVKHGLSLLIYHVNTLLYRDVFIFNDAAFDSVEKKKIIYLHSVQSGT